MVRQSMNLEWNSPLSKEQPLPTKPKITSIVWSQINKVRARSLWWTRIRNGLPECDKPTRSTRTTATPTPLSWMKSRSCHACPFWITTSRSCVSWQTVTWRAASTRINSRIEWRRTSFMTRSTRSSRKSNWIPWKCQQFWRAWMLHSGEARNLEAHCQLMELIKYMEALLAQLLVVVAQECDDTIHQRRAATSL